MQYPYARTQGKGLHGYKGTCSHACMHASCARRAFFAPPSAPSKPFNNKARRLRHCQNPTRPSHSIVPHQQSAIDQYRPTRSDLAQLSPMARPLLRFPSLTVPSHQPPLSNLT